MTEKRKAELLDNMFEYLINYGVELENIGVDETTETDTAYNECLGYIVELVGNDGNKYFFEKVLGFTKEEVLGEGMGWVYD